MALSPTAQWAHFYSRAGFRSFPVWPGEKRPMYSGWQTGATTDPELIERYFVDPARNIGVVTGESFDAWDIEVEHVPAFMDFVARQAPQTECGFGAAHGALPEAPIASTGRGGLHILTTPTGFNGTRRLHLDGVHVGELKSRGGFILVCPSVTEQMYRWTWLPERLALLPAPEWLLGLLERPATTHRTLPTRLASPDDVVAVLGRLAGSVQYVGEGGRNNYLYWAVRRAVEEGVPARHAERVLTVAAREAGLDEHEISQTIESALHAESVAA